MECPKCKLQQPDGRAECLGCGLIFSKYEAWKKRRAQWEARRKGVSSSSDPRPGGALPPVPGSPGEGRFAAPVPGGGEWPSAVASRGGALNGHAAGSEEAYDPASYVRGQLEQDFARVKVLKVKQQYESAEFWVGVETRNHYVVRGLGRVMFHVAEEGGNVGAMLSRNFLRSARPFNMSVKTAGGIPFLTLERPFRFYLHELEVWDGDGFKIGTVHREFSLLRRLYLIKDDTGREVLRIVGPIWRPWTFRALIGERQIGLIQKKWSGYLKESFTDADNFRVEFSEGLTLLQRKLLLGAVFLIDFIHFEDNSQNRRRGSYSRGGLGSLFRN